MLDVGRECTCGGRFAPLYDPSSQITAFDYLVEVAVLYPDDLEPLCRDSTFTFSHFCSD